MVVDIADVRRGTVTLPAEGDIVVYDPIGGPIGVAIATELGGRAVLVTQDNIAGNELSRTGDLAPANVRLAQAGVRIERRSLLRRVGAGEVVVARPLHRRRAGARRAPALVDCGFRLPTDPLAGRIGPGRRLRGAAHRPRGRPRGPARRPDPLTLGPARLVPSGAMGHRRRFGLAVLASVALATACNDTDTTAPTDTGTATTTLDVGTTGAIATPDTPDTTAVPTTSVPTPRR